MTYQAHNKLKCDLLSKIMFL